MSSSRGSLVARGLACASISLSSAAAAQQAMPLDPVVVTASRTAQPLSTALPATTVITREDIADSGAIDLASLLRAQAGVEVAQAGGIGSQTSIFLRGANSNQVLVLVDGLRINALSSGIAPVGQLTIDQIERVEIVRGNVSSLYGSEAIGGVIQVFTRGGGGTGSHANASASAGNERTRAASVDGAYAFGPTDARTRVGLAVSYRTARGFSAIDADRVRAANPDDDGYRNTSFSTQLSQRVGEHEVGARYFESHGHLAFDDPTDYGFFGPPYDGRVQTHDERARQNDGQVYALLKPASFWSLELRAGQTRDLSVNTSSYPFSFVTGTTTSTDRQYRAGNTLRFDAHAATIAVEHLDQRGFSTSYGNGVDGATFSRRVDSAMAGYVGPLFLPASVNEFQLNARHDDYSDFGGATTGLAAYGLTFVPGWKAIVQASNAFKAPTFNELYFPFYGNPALRPERARSVEAALQFARGSTLARLSAYRTRTRDLIVYDPFLFLANNVDRATVRGVELSLRALVDDWSLQLDASADRPIDEGTRQVLLRRATHHGRAAIARSFGPLRVTADVASSGRRYDSDIETFARTPLGGYTVANAGVRYAIDRRTTLGVQVTNALDRRYALVDGYNVPGRVVVASLALSQ